MIQGEVNTAVPLQVVLGDGRTDLFVRATIVTPTGGAVATLPLPHRTKGMYSDVYTFNAEGYYDAIYQVFTDAGFTIPATDYQQDADLVEISSVKTNIARLLALAHENTVLDSQTYDAGGKLLTASLKAYNSKTNADLNDGVTGLLFTWTVTATYDGQGRPTLFKIGRLT